MASFCKVIRKGEIVEFIQDIFYQNGHILYQIIKSLN